ncbi:hypothetical protein C7C46_09405 [Streptomyces tateyamensis]|uniref:Integral membrane protein n=1 Tax=Streptomyces tateyamensis TaxID=565073 RepID=A0A2V4NNX2_9ACTN|nr:hypothetical protein [Streptomyces tateyamensis]PYC82570.1 hypothetical protein C7C46_09405 [Streptomyces tateyamensis]
MQKHDQSETVRSAAGFAGGAAALVLLAAATGSHWLVMPAIGMLVSSTALAYRADRSATWVAWVAGATISALVAWTLPEYRTISLPLSGVQAVIAIVLLLLWPRIRNAR